MIFSFPRKSLGVKIRCGAGNAQIACRSFRRVDAIDIVGIQRESRTTNDKVIFDRSERGRRRGTPCSLSLLAHYDLVLSGLERSAPVAGESNVAGIISSD